METKEIARDQWLPFLNQFSKSHQGEIADVEIIGDAVGVQHESRGMPFVGISADDAGSEKGAIAVMLGTEPENHVEHIIAGVTRLWAKSGAGDSSDALEIEAGDGTKTIVQLQPASRR
jgi:hypothetical protein